MVILPKEKPVLGKLNSYYLRLRKLLEHCQGEFGSGCIHFEAPAAEGMVFFDKDEVLNGVFVSKEGETEGPQAIDTLLDAVGYNFTINIFYIAPELVYFWAHMPMAKVIYKNLSTEFTDFEVLYSKMRSEKLTGFFNILLNNGEGSALYFLNNGEVVGGSCSWKIVGNFGSKENLDLLFTKLKTVGGIFHVNKISSLNALVGYETKEPVGQQTSLNVFESLEELLIIVERTGLENRKMKEKFSLLLKNKFVQKADQYTFLDPFAAEFEYAGHKITYAGSSTDKEVFRGVVESVKELAGELGILPQVQDAAGAWRQKYVEMIREFDINF